MRKVATFRAWNTVCQATARLRIASERVVLRHRRHVIGRTFASWGQHCRHQVDEPGREAMHRIYFLQLVEKIVQRRLRRHFHSWLCLLNVAKTEYLAEEHWVISSVSYSFAVWLQAARYSCRLRSGMIQLCLANAYRLLQNAFDTFVIFAQTGTV